MNKIVIIPIFFLLSCALGIIEPNIDRLIQIQSLLNERTEISTLRIIKDSIEVNYDKKYQKLQIPDSLLHKVDKLLRVENVAVVKITRNHIRFVYRGSNSYTGVIHFFSSKELVEKAYTDLKKLSVEGWYLYRDSRKAP